MDHNHLTIKTFMAIMAERDAAIQERNLALDERKRAFAERDMAMLQRDAALAERNSAMQQRNEAIATLRFQGNNNSNFMISTPSEFPENTTPTQGPNRNFTTNQEILPMFEIPEPTYQVQVQVQSPKGVKSPRVGRRRGESVKSKQEVTFGSQRDFTDQEMFDIPEDVYQVQVQSAKGVKLSKGRRRRGESLKLKQEEWKDESELNRVNFDESTMPVPVCSCTGVLQPCYRWGSGGWQSACCTTTMSMYPLPLVSKKKYSRTGGRKMSGGAFSKLLTRLSCEGYYDPSTPIDLKEHWAKHGTNRYSTVK